MLQETIYYWANEISLIVIFDRILIFKEMLTNEPLLFNLLDLSVYIQYTLGHQVFFYRRIY